MRKLLQYSRHASSYLLVIFLLGMLGLPLLFGSLAGAICLLLASVWLVWPSGMAFRVYRLPLFQKIWILVACSFVPLFMLSTKQVETAFFALSFVAFVLAAAVYLFLVWAKPFQPIMLAVHFATIGLAIGCCWAVAHVHLFDGLRAAALVGGGPNLISRIAVCLFHIAVIPLFFEKKHGRHYWREVIAFVCMLTVIVYSGSRGVLLIVPAIVFLPLVLSRPIRLLISPGFWIAFILSISALVVLAYLLDPMGYVSDGLWRVYSVFSGQTLDHSTNARFLMWQVAYTAFLENPTIGTGWHSFIEVTQGTSLEIFSQTYGYFSFHADIANFAVAGGIIGLGLYFMLLFAPLIFWQTPKDHPYFKLRLYWAVTLPIVYILLGLTDMVIGYDYLTMFYAFSFALIWAATEVKEDSSK